MHTLVFKYIATLYNNTNGVIVVITSLIQKVVNAYISAYIATLYNYTTDIIVIITSLIQKVINAYISA